MMKRLIYMMLIMGSTLGFLSCERRTLYDGYGGRLYIEIELQVEVEEEMQRERTALPDLFTVAFYHPDTHKLLYTDYVPAGGGYVEVPPATYDIMIYNFGTEYTQIQGHNNLNTLEAFTTEVTSDVSSRFHQVAEIISRHKSPEISRSYQNTPLIFEPDHLYADLVKRFTIPSSISEDDYVVVHTRPNTILERYTITIGPVKNGEYISTAEVFLTGMASGKWVAERTISQGPATIWFPITTNAEQSKFYTVFHTFGRYPGTTNRVFLIVHLTDIAGNEYEGEWDVTDQVEDGGHDIVIDDEIDIPEPQSGGGFTPSVTVWDEENIIIDL